MTTPNNIQDDLELQNQPEEKEITINQENYVEVPENTSEPEEKFFHIKTEAELKAEEEEAKKLAEQKAKEPPVDSQDSKKGFRDKEKEKQERYEKKKNQFISKYKPTEVPEDISLEDAKDMLRNINDKYTDIYDKYNVYAGSLSSKDQTIKALTDKIAFYENAMQYAQEDPTKQDDKELEVTKEEEELYGKDYIKLIEKVSKRVSIDTAKPIETQVNSLYNDFGAKEMQQEQRSFNETLRKMVPDLDSKNRDAEFLDWLQEYEPAAGLDRRTLLSDAYMKRDPGRVKMIFDSYFGEGSKYPTQEELDSSKRNTEKKAELERQVQPAKSKASAAELPPTRRVRTFTNKEIQDFYSNKARNMYSKEEAAKMNKEIEEFVYLKMSGQI